MLHPGPTLFYSFQNFLCSNRVGDAAVVRLTQEQATIDVHSDVPLEPNDLSFRLCLLASVTLSVTIHRPQGLSGAGRFLLKGDHSVSTVSPSHDEIESFI
jgi:hypothetical protein